MNLPRRMDQHDKLKIRAAAHRVHRIGLPPAVAELLSRELLVWEDLGYWLGTSSVVRRAVEEVMKWPTVAVAEEERKLGMKAGAGAGVVGGGAVGYE